MLLGLLALLVYQLVGESLAYGLPVLVPGPVIGMALLFLVLLGMERFRGADFAEKAGGIAGTGDFILRNMALLFVPAGVGVVQKMDLVTTHGIGLVVTIVGSTVVTLVATVAAFLLASKYFGGADAGEPAGND